MGMYDQLVGMEEILDDLVIDIKELLDQLNEDQDDLINHVFRAYHTIKCTSGFLNFDNYTELARAAEDVLNIIRNGQLEPHPNVADVLLETGRIN